MGNEAYAQIGKRMKAYRNERGLSQEELAEGICSSSTISLLETGQHIPSAEIMSRIADRLAVPLNELLLDQEHALDAKLQVDLVKVYVEMRSYDRALQLMQELEQQQLLRDFQSRELTLYKAECLLQIGKANQSLVLLTDLQQKLEQNRETDDRFMALLYDKLGKANYYLSNVSDTHAHYLRAYQLTLRFPVFDDVSAKITYNLGMVLRDLQRHNEAIHYLEKAEGFFAQHTDLHSLAHTYMELGIAYQGAKQLEQASHYLKESLVINQALNRISMATHVKRTHASLVLSHTDPNKAIEELKTCASDFEKAGLEDRCIQTYSHLARVLLLEKRISEAGEYLQKVMSAVTEADAEHDPRLAYVYQVYAMYLLETEDFAGCETYSRKALGIFEAMGYGKNSGDALYLTAIASRKQEKWEKAAYILEDVNQKLLRLLQYNLSADFEVI